MRKFFNDPRVFFTIIILLVAIPIILSEVGLPSWPLTSFLAGVATTLMKHPFKGFLQSLVAGVFVGWGAYIWRVRIRRFFQPHLIYIRAPLMLGVAPLIVARSREVAIWEKHGLNIDLDFRYAGRSALKDLFNPNSKCPIAVASDVALSSFIGEKKGREHKPKIIPFVRIEDHLKIIVRKAIQGNSEYEKFSALKGKNIGYYRDSVHDDFLDELQLYDVNLLKPMPSILHCYHALTVSKEVEACVLWEPHYHAFNEMEDIYIINDEDEDPYFWFLCLVATNDYIENNEQSVQKILGALDDAARYCQLESNEHELIKDCMAFLHTEFTGIDRDGLVHLLRKRQHHFGIKENLENFNKKLDKLVDKGGDRAIGASNLKNSLWPGLNT